MDRSPLHDSADFTAAGNDQLVLTPASGKAIKIERISVNTDTSMTISVKFGASGDSDKKIVGDNYGANGGDNLDLSKENVTGAIDETVTIDLSANGNVAVVVDYKEN